MEPGEYVKAVRRRWPVVIVAVVLAGTLAWLTAPDGPTKAQYQATAIVSVRPTTGATTVLEPTSAEIVATQATSTEVSTRAKGKLGYNGSPDKLAAQIQTKFDTKGNSVRITSTEPSAARATDVANTFTRELLSYLQERQESQVQSAIDAGNKSLSDLQAQAATLDQRIAASTDPAEQARLKTDRSAIDRQVTSVLTRLDQLDNLRGPGTARAILVRDAAATKVFPDLQPPTDATARAAIACAVGLLLGIALALFLDRLDATLRTRRQLEAASGLPVIAEVPRVRTAGNRVDVAVRPRSAVAESYRTLRTATMFMPPTEGGPWRSQNGSRTAPGDNGDAVPVDSRSPDADPPGAEGRLIVLTGTGPGEGTTSVAVNLAAAFAETGKSVIIAGADLRRPAVAGHFGLSETPGITDVLSRPPGSPPPRAIRRTSIPGLSLLPSGTPVENPAAMLTRAHDLILQCRGLADVVIVDTPPLLLANDGVEFVLAADAVIMVARCGCTTADSAHRAAELLRRVKAPVIGVAMMGLSGKSSSRYFDRGGPSRSDTKRRRSASVASQV